MRNLERLHSLESQIIELHVLMKALSDTCTEDGLQICLSNTLLEKIKGLESQFYELWDGVVLQ